MLSDCVLPSQPIIACFPHNSQFSKRLLEKNEKSILQLKFKMSEKVEHADMIIANHDGNFKF